MDSSCWLDNNYQILMVTFSNWLTGDALLWFIEFLFEITSSDQLTHITQLFTQHLISYPFLKVAHNTKEYAEHSGKILHSSPETVKVFKMSR